MNYHWRNRAWSPGNPQEIGEHVQRLADRHGGKLTIDILVKDASRSNSPLHCLCDWDDATAAQKYRAMRMRNTLSILGTSHNGSSVRAFMGFTNAEAQCEYRPLERVLKSQRLREIQAAKERKRLASLFDRIAIYPELQGARKLIERALEEAGELAMA